MITGSRSGSQLQEVMRIFRCFLLPVRAVSISYINKDTTKEKKKKKKKWEAGGILFGRTAARRIAFHLS